MKSITLIFFYSLLLSFFNTDQEATPPQLGDDVTIEMIHKKDLGFEFSVKYLAWRNQIHVRSEEPIRTLRLMVDDKEKKSYNIIGSSLVILPMADFNNGTTHEMEVKFIKNDEVVVAKISVGEDSK